MEFRTLGQLEDYIRKNFYTTNFKANHTRKQLGNMLNILYPFQKIQHPYSKPYSKMCKKRAMRHIEFYICLHNMRCEHLL